MLENEKHVARNQQRKQFITYVNFCRKINIHTLAGNKIAHVYYH